MKNQESLKHKELIYLIKFYENYTGAKINKEKLTTIIKCKAYLNSTIYHYFLNEKIDYLKNKCLINEDLKLTKKGNNLEILLSEKMSNKIGKAVKNYCYVRSIFNGTRFYLDRIENMKKRDMELLGRGADYKKPIDY